MKLKLAVAVLILFSGAFAQMSPELFADIYNENLADVPDFVKTAVGNENLHIYFSLANGTVHEYAAVTKKGRVEEAAMWEEADGNHAPWAAEGIRPTMELHASEEVLMGIARSENPVQALRKSWGTDIKFEPIGITSSVKVAVMNIGMFFMGLFGL